MSIETALLNAKEKINTAYDTVGTKGGTIPSVKNLSNLSEAISSIPTEAEPEGTEVSAIVLGELSSTVGTKAYLKPIEEGHPQYLDEATLENFKVSTDATTVLTSYLFGSGYIDKEVLLQRLYSNNTMFKAFKGLVTNLNSHTYQVNGSTTASDVVPVNLVRLSRGLYVGQCSGRSTASKGYIRAVRDGVIDSTNISSKALPLGLHTLPSGKYFTAGFGLDTIIYENNGGAITVAHTFSTGSTSMWPIVFKNFDGSYCYYNPATSKFYKITDNTEVGSFSAPSFNFTTNYGYPNVSKQALPLDEYGRALFYPAAKVICKLTSDNLTARAYASLDTATNVLNKLDFNPTECSVQFYNGKTYIFCGFNWFEWTGEELIKLPPIFTRGDFTTAGNHEAYHKAVFFNFDDMLAIGTYVSRSSYNIIETEIAVKSSSAIDTEFVAVPFKNVSEEEVETVLTGNTTTVPQTGFLAGDLVKVETVLPSDHIEWSKVGKVFGYNVTENQSPVEVFQQPVLTSNGTLGGSSFAVAASSVFYGRDAYFAVANNGIAEGHEWHSEKGLPQWFEFYNPEALMVSSLELTNRTRTSGVPTVFTIQGCNDGSSWEDVYSGTNATTANGATWSIPVDSNRSFKYWRIYVTDSSDLYYAVIGELKIDAMIVSGESSLNISKGQCLKSEDPLQIVMSQYDSYEVPLSTLKEGQEVGLVNDLYILGANAIDYNFKICTEGTEPVLPSGYTFSVNLNHKVYLNSDKTQIVTAQPESMSVSTTGTLTISEGIMTGFSTANYITLGV